jgi:hypothetical protein
MPAMRGLVLLVVALLAVSCAGSADESDDAVEEATTTTMTATTVTTVPTNGWVQVGTETFDLVFTCYAAGAGDVAAIGVGENAGTGEQVEALVQGFLGQPYLGVTVGSSIRYEASLEEPLEVYVHDDTISAGAVRWERDLDLESGGGDVVGYGAVFVECASYEKRLPEGY